MYCLPSHYIANYINLREETRHSLICSRTAINREEMISHFFAAVRRLRFLMPAIPAVIHQAPIVLPVMPHAPVFLPVMPHAPVFLPVMPHAPVVLPVMPHAPVGSPYLFSITFLTAPAATQISQEMGHVPVRKLNPK